MKTYIKPELQVREIRVEENLAKVDWSVKNGQVVTEYGQLTALAALTTSGSGAQNA